MSRTEILNRYILRKDSSEKWTENNPILALGEVGYDTTHKYFKVGDGSTRWSELKYYCETDFDALTDRVSTLETSVTDLSAVDGVLGANIAANTTAITDATGRISNLESKTSNLSSEGEIAADNITYTLNEETTNIKSVVDDLVTSAGYVGSYNGNFDDILGF